MKITDSHLSSERFSRPSFKKAKHTKSKTYNENSKNDIKYVSHTYPCHICGKPDWCAYTVNYDGDKILALCQRKSSGSIKQAKDNSYIHLIKDAPKLADYIKPSPLILNLKADITRCNAVYTSLLEKVRVNNEGADNIELSALYSYHADALLQRGLGDDTIARNLYASVPNRIVGDNLAETLSKEFNLEGIPGFYKNTNGKWCLNTYHKGYYVPFRNHKGLIFGIQIRLDVPIDRKKYVWLSTANKEGGASSGSPLHFVNTNIIKETNAIYVTEGTLKADVIGEIGKVGVTAMAGVRTVRSRDLVEVIQVLFPNLKQVFLALDMDFQTNETVGKVLLDLEMEFQKWNGLEVNTLIWDINDGKGFDDYLLQIGESENE